MYIRPSLDFYTPDGVSLGDALKRTTRMGIMAHQDDLEISAYHGILKCYGKRSFFGVIVTDGAGSPRSGTYALYSKNKIKMVRKQEQKEAAKKGAYSGIAFLDYDSIAARDKNNQNLIKDIQSLVTQSGASVIYTHNPADKHDTHVAVVLKVISAMRGLNIKSDAYRLYGCEAWRDLDWLLDKDKIVFDVSANKKLAASILRVFNSQIAGGKRYDLGTLGRRMSNATFLHPSMTDKAKFVIYGMDLTPLILNKNMSIASYVSDYVDKFKSDILERIKNLS